ncbi:hypothetical protein J8A87_25910 [Vibrio parahaemolyticus]|nr:hypothetical protein [Vibrio parahaemolyticus]
MKNLVIQIAKEAIAYNALNVSVDLLISPFREEYEHGDDTYDLPSETMPNFVHSFKYRDYTEQELSLALAEAKGDLFASLCNAVKDSPYKAPEKVKPLQRVRAHGLMHGALTLISDWLVTVEKDESLKSLVTNILKQKPASEYMSCRGTLVHCSLSSGDINMIYDAIDALYEDKAFLEAKEMVESLYVSHFEEFVKSYY